MNPALIAIAAPIAKAAGIAVVSGAFAAFKSGTPKPEYVRDAERLAGELQLLEMRSQDASELILLEGLIEAKKNALALALDACRDSAAWDKIGVNQSAMEEIARTVASGIFGAAPELMKLVSR